MRILKSLAVLMIPLALLSCKTKSKELFPCMCDNDNKTLGILNCMCEKAPEKPYSFIKNTASPDQDQLYAYTYLHNSRNTYAPVKLEYVDFRIPRESRFDQFNTKLGNYRFRIYGCRRFDKEIFLNRGRAMQKDMRFFDIFFENMNPYYPVVVDTKSPYYPLSDRIEQPHYLLSAEIIDYFMNICDEYDWNNVKKVDLRKGTSEITVTWRLMDVNKNKVYCKGTTTGYGELRDGEYKSETLLVERAFKDALLKLPSIGCFNAQLTKFLPPEKLVAQTVLPADTFNVQYEPEIKAVKLLQECGSGIPVTALIDERPGYDEKITIDERSGLETSCSNIDETGGSTVINNRCDGAKVDGSLLKTNDIKLVDDFWIEVPLNDDSADARRSRKMAEEDFSSANNQFCIQNVRPYKDLNPQNLYRVRASIVNVENPMGKKGAGLLISDQLVLTSADILLKDNNNFDIETINGIHFKATAFRVNPNKNVALLVLQEKARFNPLPLSLTLPRVGEGTFLTLGLLNPDEGENYIDNEGEVIGYHYTQPRGAEIIVDTFVQNYTLGGALIDQKGNIIGIAHTEKLNDDDPDLFIPVETALKALGTSICGRAFPTVQIPSETIVKTVTREKPRYTPRPQPASEPFEPVLKEMVITPQKVVLDKPITKALESNKPKEPVILEKIEIK